MAKRRRESINTLRLRPGFHIDDAGRIRPLKTEGTNTLRLRPGFHIDDTGRIRPLGSDIDRDTQEIDDARLSRNRASSQALEDRQRLAADAGTASGIATARASIAALPPRLPQTAATLAVTEEIADIEGIVDDARRNPTRANTDFAVKSLIAFPHEELFFPDGEVGRSSKLALNRIDSVNNLLSSGRITLDEAVQTIEPFRRQLERTARRRDAKEAEVRNGEFLAATEEDALATDVRARENLAAAVDEKSSLEERIANIETGEDTPDATILTALFRDLAQAEDTVRALRSGAVDAETALGSARAGRLASLAPQGGARVEFETGEVVVETGEDRTRPIDIPGSDIRRELAQIDPRETPAGEVPNEEQKRSIRKDFRGRIKAAKTHAEKKELASEMRAALQGRKTATVKAREDIAAFDAIDVAGVRRTPELEAQDAKFNADLNKKIERIKQAIPSATGNKAKRLRKEFERASKQLISNLKAQSKVLETREAAETKKVSDAHDIAVERLADARESKDRARIEKAAKEERDTAADVEADALVITERKAAAALKADTAAKTKAETEAKVVAKAREDRARTIKVDKLSLQVSFKKQAWTTARRKHSAANEILKDFREKKEKAIRDKSSFVVTKTVADGDGFKEVFVPWVKDGTETPEGAAEFARLANANSDALAASEVKKTAFEDSARAVTAAKTAPAPPKPSAPGQVPTREILQQYKDFYGDRDVVENMLKLNGWSI